jgi:hypothetical protein
MIPVAYHFSMSPRDIDAMTIGEFEVFVAAVAEMERQHKQRQKDAGSPDRKR